MKIIYGTIMVVFISVIWVIGGKGWVKDFFIMVQEA